ncbi:ABC transporter substrate-binding protein [Paenibacillus sp. GSMTC-2017]|nr:ABC transporter substrate-binding protein [Paenibacillus sp. GSMTC-2017]
MATLASCSSDTVKDANKTTTPVELEQAKVTPSDSEPFAKIVDTSGAEVVLNKKPERIVVLSPETLELFYQLGGDVVGYSTTPVIPIPEGAKDALNVGQVHNVSLEMLTSLKPDLVIGQSFFNANLKEPLAASDIPLLLVSASSLENFEKIGKIYGQVLGKESETAESFKQLNERIDSITSKLPKHKHTFAVVLVGPMGFLVEKGQSLTTDIATKMNMINIADQIEGDSSRGAVPFSLESMVEIDPEYLLVVVHGTEELGRKMVKENMDSNAAWSSLRAFKEDKIYFLPSALENFPSLTLDQEVQKMVDHVYSHLPKK